MLLSTGPSCALQHYNPGDTRARESSEKEKSWVSGKKYTRWKEIHSLGRNTRVHTGRTPHTTAVTRILSQTRQHKISCSGKWRLTEKICYAALRWNIIDSLDSTRRTRFKFLAGKSNSYRKLAYTPTEGFFGGTKVLYEGPAKKIANFTLFKFLNKFPSLFFRKTY